MSKNKSELVIGAELLLRCEAVRLAAISVIEAWDSGTIVAAQNSCAGITVACLRDALDGYISEDVLAQLNDGDE